MSLALYLGYGGISAIAMIALGEVTSPLQNIWFINKNLRYRRKWADDLFAYVSWVYAAFYVFVRSLVGPVVVRAPLLCLQNQMQSFSDTVILERYVHVIIA